MQVDSLAGKQISTWEKSNLNVMYLLLFNSNGGGPALVPCPWAVHKRPMRVVAGVVGDIAVVDEVDGFLIVAIDEGGRMPVGLGKRDDAVDTSLLIDFSDGAGDGERSIPSKDGSGFVSLILIYFYQFFSYVVLKFYGLLFTFLWT